MARSTRTQNIIQGAIIISTSFFLTGLLYTVVYSIIINKFQHHTLIKSMTSTTPKSPMSESLSSWNHVTDLQRIRHVLRRLSYYEGGGRGSTRIRHMIVSLVGIFGMFAAVIGALLAPWLVEAGNSILDDDHFTYWVGEHDDDDDEQDGFQRACGPERERKFSLVRVLDIA